MIGYNNLGKTSSSGGALWGGILEVVNWRSGQAWFKRCAQAMLTWRLSGSRHIPEGQALAKGHQELGVALLYCFRLFVNAPCLRGSRKKIDLQTASAKPQCLGGRLSIALFVFRDLSKTTKVLISARSAAAKALMGS